MPPQPPSPSPPSLGSHGLSKVINYVEELKSYVSLGHWALMMKANIASIHGGVNDGIYTHLNGTSGKQVR